MKRILIMCFFVHGAYFTYATNYYVDTTGSDTNEGTSTSAAWKTISKVNSSFALLSPGDRLLFKCGQTFYGSLVLTRSGSPGSQITLGAYGSGKKPVISGFTWATGFSNVGTNLWESNAINHAYKPNMVLLKNMPANIGRYPNTGYLTFEKSVGDSSITDTRLTGSPNWTGAEIIIRKTHWIISRDVILNHYGNTITYKGISGYSSKNGYGYFLQNSLATLDTLNEWYFNNGTKKITIYARNSPENVKVSVRDTLLYIGPYDYITVDGIAFEGANMAAAYIGSMRNQAKNIVVKNCDFNFSGRDAIYGTNNTNCSIINCRINYSWNNGIVFGNQGGRSLHSTISNNVLKNIGYKAGMGYMNVAAHYNVSYSGISIFGDNSLIQYNVIDTIGYNPINYYYDSSKVKYNKVNYYCFVKDDGAGIYTWTGYDGVDQYVGRKVISNVITNGIGAGEGTLDGKPNVQGIYLDDGTCGVMVDSNTVYKAAYSGIYIHNTRFSSVTNNLVYDCKGTQLLIVHDQASPDSPIRSLVMKNNLFISRDPVPVVLIRSSRNDIDSFNLRENLIDSNFYYRPIDDSLIIKVIKKTGAGYITTNYTLATWKTTFAAYDVHSVKAPINFDTPITTANIDNYIRFEYNATGNSSVRSLGNYRYRNMVQTNLTGTYTLPAFGSVLLFRNGMGTGGRKLIK